jgi:predicted N-formylglutamate amidohydrolase
MTTPSNSYVRSFSPRAVFHLPHAARAIPSDVREQFLVSDERLADEIRLMTDHLTDELFAVPEATALAVRFPVSRLVVDPERFEADEQEPMAARGMGVIYDRTCRQTPLRRPLIEPERQALLERWYRPHHRSLTGAVDTVLQTRDTCLIVAWDTAPVRPVRRTDRRLQVLPGSAGRPTQTRSAPHRCRASSESRARWVVGPRLSRAPSSPTHSRRKPTH